MSIQKNYSNKQIMEFIDYLNDHITVEDISPLSRALLVRSIWSLPRLGYTYSSSSTTHQNSRLVNCLLQIILVLLTLFTDL